MHEDSYTIKEVMEEKFGQMEAHLLEIKAQTQRTNGRVNKLENWRSGIVACIALMSFLIPIVISYAK